ncbi:hypothetical protein JTB14_015238 [Gonioctena quinquepunctata]|nr:hypothetical protein JTB14_015238 [Gonioctena quinquepunctata]
MKANLYADDLVSNTSGKNIHSTGHLAIGLKIFEDYGPKLRVFVGPFMPALMVADEKFLKFILSSSKFTRKPVHYETFRNWLGSGLLINEGSDWKRKRRMVAPSFHNSLLHNYFETFERIGDIFMRKLEPEVGKESYDIMPLSSLLTLDIIYESALGESLNAQGNSNMEYVECVETVCGIVSSRMKSPVPYFLFPLTLDYWRERKAIKVMHKRTNEIIDRRRKGAVLDIDQHNDGSTKRMAFLDLLLGSTVDGRRLTTDELRDEIETFIFGGAHTVAVVVAFTIHCLAHNPEVQKKAVDEQMAIFGVITNAQPTFSDLDKMEYLDMVIMECMRLYPPVPGIMRDLSQGFEYEGNTYQGVTMIAVIMAAHRNPKNFPDPLKIQS